MNTTTTSSTNARHAASPVDPVAACACHLYDAECALRAAHQSGVDEWVTSAAAKLHQAVVDYLAALAATEPSDGQQ